MGYVDLEFSLRVQVGDVHMGINSILYTVNVYIGMKW